MAQQKLNLGCEARLALLPGYSSSCLPKTMELARRNQRGLEQFLGRFSKAWPFEDCILAMLLPSMVPDIEAYHKSGGREMTHMFATHQLERFDTSLCEQLGKFFDLRQKRAHREKRYKQSRRSIEA